MPAPGEPLMVGVGFVLAAFVALIAGQLRALTPSGAIGATVIGGMVFGFGGLTWAVALVAFFISSSLLSRMGRRRKAHLTLEKEGPRDLAQTLANGGLALLAALAVGLTGHGSPWYPYFTLAYFGSLAAATADTWATELGVLSKQQPRLITTGEETPRGFSGGVTWVGLLASLAGGVFIGMTIFVTIQAASLLSTGQWFWQDRFLLLVLPLAGMLASLADSFLGATVQRLYYCERCQSPTEHPVHCDQPARHIRGLAWMNNDVVNFMMTCIGAAVAILLSLPFLPQ